MLVRQQTAQHYAIDQCANPDESAHLTNFQLVCPRPAIPAVKVPKGYRLIEMID